MDRAANKDSVNHLEKSAFPADEQELHAPGRQAPQLAGKDRRCQIELFQGETTSPVVELTILDRRGNANARYRVEGLPAERVAGIASAVQNQSVQTALETLSESLRASRTERRPALVHEIPVPVQPICFETDDGRSTIMKTSVRPEDLHDFAQGCDRIETELTQLDPSGNSSRLVVLIETDFEGNATGRADLESPGARLTFLIETGDEKKSIATLSQHAFEIMDLFRSQGAQELIEAYSPAGSDPITGYDSGSNAHFADSSDFSEIDGADGGIAEWSPDKDRYEQLRDEAEERGTYIPDPRKRAEPGYPDNARLIERELQSGAQLKALFNDREALIYIAPQDLEEGDRVIYKIRFSSFDSQANVKKIEELVSRLSSDNLDIARKAVDSLTSLGNWDVFCQQGEKNHPAIVELRDLARWEIKGGDWHAFPLEEGNDHDYWLLQGYEFGVFNIKGRPAQEFSCITFMLDENGDGTVTLNNELGAELRFTLPRLGAVTGDELFGRRHQLKQTLEDFASDPGRAIGDLFDECGCEAKQLPFPYDRKTYEAYQNVAEIYGLFKEHLAEKCGRFSASMIKYEGDGVFRAYLPSYSYHGFSTLLHVDHEGVRRVELWRNNPRPLLGLIGAKQHLVFDLDPERRAHLSLEKIFEHLTPMDAFDGNRCARDLIDYLTVFSPEHQGLLGSIRTWLQAAGLWRHKNDYF
jgi:hypothetical protein